MSDVRKVIIIGSGPAGLTAAIYAARANLKPLMFEGFNAGGLIPGGQLMFTTDVENYPGFVDPITGPDLMGRFRGQAERQGTELITSDVTKVDFSERPFKVWDEDDLYLAQTVIIATGARANYLGLESEEKLKNELPKHVRITSFEQVSNVVKRALPALELHVDTSPPSAIPVRPENLYLRFAQRGRSVFPTRQNYCAFAARRCRRRFR